MFVEIYRRSKISASNCCCQKHNEIEQLLRCDSAGTQQWRCLHPLPFCDYTHHQLCKTDERQEEEDTRKRNEIVEIWNVTLRTIKLDLKN